MSTVERPPSAGKGSRPSIATPPHLEPAVKAAVGRAIARGTAQVEGFMRRRGVSPGDAQDIALECALITYRSVAKGTLLLPTDGVYDQKLAKYMHTAAWHMLGNQKQTGEIFHRRQRESDTVLLAMRGHDVEPAIELASEIAAQPPKARRFLLAMLRTGNEPCIAAVAVGIAKTDGKRALKRVRRRVAKRLAAV